MAATALLQAAAPTCSCCNGASLSFVRAAVALFLLHIYIGMSAEQTEWTEVKLDCAALVTSAGGDLRAAAPAGAQQHRP